MTSRALISKTNCTSSMHNKNSNETTDWPMSHAKRVTKDNRKIQTDKKPDRQKLMAKPC